MSDLPAQDEGESWDVLAAIERMAEFANAVSPVPLPVVLPHADTQIFDRDRIGSAIRSGLGHYLYS